MFEALCYILPVCQGFETPKASCTREAETKRGQQHEELESYSDVAQHCCLTDGEMNDELGHRLPRIGSPGWDPHYMVQMRVQWYDHDYFRPRVYLGIQCRADSTLGNACTTRPGKAGYVVPGAYLRADLCESTANGATRIGDLPPMTLPFHRP
jgi:hypothetical protein